MVVTLLLPVPSRQAKMKRLQVAWEQRDQRHQKRRMAVETVLLVLAVRSPCWRWQGSMLQLEEGRQEGSRRMMVGRSSELLPMLPVMMPQRTTGF